MACTVARRPRPKRERLPGPDLAGARDAAAGPLGGRQRLGDEGPRAAARGSSGCGLAGCGNRRRRSWPGPRTSCERRGYPWRNAQKRRLRRSGAPRAMRHNPLKTHDRPKPHLAPFYLAIVRLCLPALPASDAHPCCARARQCCDETAKPVIAGLAAIGSARRTGRRIAAHGGPDRALDSCAEGRGRDCCPRCRWTAPATAIDCTDEERRACPGERIGGGHSDGASRSRRRRGTGRARRHRRGFRPAADGRSRDSLRSGRDRHCRPRESPASRSGRAFRADTPRPPDVVVRVEGIAAEAVARAQLRPGRRA